jgi:hypothetical protein
MDAPAALKEQLASAQELLETVMEDVDQAHFNAKPAGVANSIGQNYVHTIIGEDYCVNAMIRQGAPLHASSWQGRTGATGEIPPPMQGTPEWHRFVDSSNIELTAFRAYAKAVHESALDFIGSLPANELDHELDLPMIGRHTLNWLLFNFVIGHIANHTGEIAALKGVAGLKGYPF